jgi:hypothetical protein
MADKMCIFGSGVAIVIWLEVIVPGRLNHVNSPGAKGPKEESTVRIPDGTNVTPALA